MTEEFRLSDKIETKMWAEDRVDPTREPDQFGEGFWVEDVKEFIRRLKENLNKSDFISSLHTMLYHTLLQHIEDEIDKLAGEDLK